MPVDAFVLLTPLLLLALLLPVLFVGCGELLTDSYSDEVRVLLAFAQAVADQNRPDMVSQAPIIKLTVHFVLTGGAPGELEFIQSRESVSPPSPIDAASSTPVYLDLSPVDRHNRTDVRCVCDVMVEGGQVITTAPVQLPLREGYQLEFGLVRTARSPELFAAAPFSVQYRTVKN